MRLAGVLIIFSAGLVASQAGAQPSAVPLLGAPAPSTIRRIPAPEPVIPPPENPADDGALAPVVESQPGMTLAELENLALSSNPTLAQAAARVEAARGNRVQVGLYPNPVAGYIGAEMGNDGRAGQQGAFFSQEIVTADKLKLNRRVASQSVRQAEYNFEMQRQRVLTDVRRCYYDVLVSQRTVEITEQLAQISEEGVKSVEALMKAKEVAPADLLHARIEAETAKVTHVKAHSRYTTAWRKLAAVTGMADMGPRPLAGDPREGVVRLTWDDALGQLLAQSAELGRAETGVTRARAALDRACAGRIPNVNLESSVQYDNATEDTFVTVQVGLPVPIYNRNQGNICRAQAELLAAEGEVRRVRLELQQRLAAVYDQYETAHYQVEAYSRDVLPSAQESLELANKGYRQGEYNYLFLLTAQRTYFQTNVVYLDALRELRAAAAAIEGDLLTDGLETVDTWDAGFPEP